MEEIVNAPISTSAQQRFKSVRRAIKRGLVSPFGVVYPKRPFNNRGNSNTNGKYHSRTMNELKKKIYVGIQDKKRIV